ncbi:hypothetical protein K501DRAFT_267249 [Backusella circina FSU 941]|nr:hypothetical protein K501DRAFT_267249 [Backusella circina FSU 941]
MIRNAQYSELNKAVMSQDRALNELMQNHRNMCQSNKREHRVSAVAARKPASIRSECVHDDDMSLTLVKLRIQQEKTNRLQKQYEQEQLQIQQQQQQQPKKDNKDMPKQQQIRALTMSLPSSEQKPSIMKLSSSNKLVRMLKSLKPHKDTSYSNLTDTATIIGDKESKSSLRSSSRCSCSKRSYHDSDATTLDDSSSSGNSSIKSKVYRQGSYYV